MLKSVTRWLGVDSTAKGTDYADDKRNETVETIKKENAASATVEGSSCETVTKRKASAEKENESKAEGVEEKKATSVDKETERNKEKSPSQDSTAQQKLENATAMALDTAKQVGSVLYSYGRAAGSTVVEQASKLKSVVQEKGLMGNFSQEHEKFVAEKKMCRKLQEDAVAPWVGYNEEAVMKEQILNLSTDRKHFLRDPPAEVQYEFEFATAYPIALATLKEDGNLRNMRFTLVPQKISEERFWRNYFYRVSLIKQSVQLNTLEQQQGAEGPSGSSRDDDKKGGDPDDSPETLTPHVSPHTHVQSDQQPTQTDARVKTNQEMAKQTEEEEEEEVGEDWERVQQQDVEDYEEGGGGGASGKDRGQPAGGDDEDDQEVVDLLQQIDQETDPTQALC